MQDGLQAFSVYIPLIAIVIIATSFRSRWTAPRKHSQAAYGAHTRPAWQTACSRRPGSVNFRVIYLLSHACLGALWSSGRKCPADLHHNRIGSCQASTFACECQAISGRVPGEMRLDDLLLLNSHAAARRASAPCLRAVSPALPVIPR